jgi:hypothetical protein
MGLTPIQFQVVDFTPFTFPSNSHIPKHFNHHRALGAPLRQKGQGAFGMTALPWL